VRGEAIKIMICVRKAQVFKTDKRFKEEPASRLPLLRAHLKEALTCGREKVRGGKGGRREGREGREGREARESTFPFL
jgi:hypothetical protein